MACSPNQDQNNTSKDTDDDVVKIEKADNALTETGAITEKMKIQMTNLIEKTDSHDTMIKNFAQEVKELRDALQIPGDSKEEFHFNLETDELMLKLRTDSERVKKQKNRESSVDKTMFQTQLDNITSIVHTHDRILSRLTQQMADLKTETKAKRVTSSTVDKSDWVNINPNDAVVSVAEMVKEAASEVVRNQNTYVLDESTGLYFYPESGYYYYPKHDLFGHMTTKKFYKYNATTNAYDEVKFKGRFPFPAKTKIKKSVPSSSEGVTEELEDGELSESTSAGDFDDSTNCWSPSTSSSAGTPTSHAPCMRLIVQSSSVVPFGTLFIVTCTGGTVGSDGESHTVLIPDSTIDTYHASFEYIMPHDSQQPGKYVIYDISKNHEIILNGVKLIGGSDKEPHEIQHGSTLQIGQTVLSAHIHPGSLTCGHCEPGLLMQDTTVPSGYTSSKSKERQRKSVLKQLKKKYGLESSETSTVDSNYNDRASKRRTAVGSQNPYEKTEVASVQQPIPITNKGFQMLKNMGWESGQSLGKDGSDGLKEPIPVKATSGRTGLGGSEST